MSGFSQIVHVDAAHPSLPGHFPGHPLVPGVLILEQVALALRSWRGQRLTRVLEAKFMAPLLPNQSAQLQLTCSGAETARVVFRIERDGTVLARGIVEGAA
ncbi:MAG TPA: hydroxymyristoyl-ACP dehydratase [Rhodanobacter sp.]|nr:hydroxymyristoyl-ACP dehydratase [Rhodanobacter sp.]